MTDVQEESLIRIEKAAERLGVNMITLRRWEKQGLLISVRLGPKRQRFYRKHEIEDIIAGVKDMTGGADNER